MSIANLSNPDAIQDIYGDSINVTTVNATFTQFNASSVENLVVENLQIQPAPPVNNTYDSMLAIDNVGAVVVRQASSLGGGVTTPTVSGNVAEFSNTTGGIADSGVQSNDITTLSGTQTISGAKTFTTPVVIDITNAQGTPMTFYQGAYSPGGPTWFELVFLDNGDRVNNVFAIGTNPRTDGPGPSITLWGYAPRPMRFATSGAERMRIDAAGIALDTSTNNILCLNGTSLRYRNDVVTLSQTQTLTNKTLTTPVISSISNSGTITVPTGTDTLVGRNTIDTLTNKTLTTPVISSISNSGILTLPTGADTLVGRNTIDILTNKTINNLTTTGTFDNTLNGKVTRNYISGVQTVGAVSAAFVTTVAIPNSAAMFNVQVMAFCTAGPNVNKLRTFDAVFSARNTGGAVTAFTISNNNASDGGYSPTLTIVPQVNNVVIQVTGTAGDTIIYSGIFEMVYQ